MLIENSHQVHGLHPQSGNISKRQISIKRENREEMWETVPAQQREAAAVQAKAPICALRFRRDEREGSQPLIHSARSCRPSKGDPKVVVGR
jgi:hypothetical protein